LVYRNQKRLPKVKVKSCASKILNWTESLRAEFNFLPLSLTWPQYLAALRFRFFVRLSRSLLCLFAILAAQLGIADQAPGLTWTTNIGARLFAVDAQTNLYANAGGRVIKLNADGQPLQTNAVCPLPGLAQRDSAGDFYFTGSFDGTQDFGGITLVGGFIQKVARPYSWIPGTPSCFLAKYASDGGVNWAISFGQEDFRITNRPSALQVDPGGGSYVGYLSENFAYLARFDNMGTNQFNKQIALVSGPNPGWSASGSTTLGAPTVSNISFAVYSALVEGVVQPGVVDQSGQIKGFKTLIFPCPVGLSTNARPVTDNLGQLLVTACGTNPPGTSRILCKYSTDGQVLSQTDIGVEEQWTLARDAQAGIYLGGANGTLAKYTSDGTIIWSTNTGQACVALVVDGSGNRFVSLADGSVGRLEPDFSPQPPAISIRPQLQTVFVGDTALFSVVASSGTPPFQYAWTFSGTNIPGANSSVVQLTNVTPAQAGSYELIAANAAGAVTSAPALLRVKSVEFYLQLPDSSSQLLTNGTYVFAQPQTFTLRSAFPNGASFYTLDGSPPTFASARYTQPILVSRSASLRALGYSADFLQAEEADPVEVIILERHTLTAFTPGAGTVSLDPPGGSYLATNLVTATALPAAGWSFLYWLGDTSGTIPTAILTMERDKAIQAVFGTSLSTTVAGNGQVLLSPPGGVYPFGSSVLVSAVPQPGSYFGAWGNAATGNTNPLLFRISSPQPTISSIFAASPAGQAALSVQINGQGRVELDPQSNLYAIGQSVTLTPIPGPGQTFLNWSGDVSGTQNPLIITLTQSKFLTANFTSRPALRANRPGLEGFTPQGFRFTLISQPQTRYQILGSTNLTVWDILGVVTNALGEIQFTDSNALSGSRRYYRAAPQP